MGRWGWGVFVGGFNTDISGAGAGRQQAVRRMADVMVWEKDLQADLDRYGPLLCIHACLT